MAPLANNHISVDCVVFGFDGYRLNVLLVKRNGEDEKGKYNDRKLPGSLIYLDENLDEAAGRVLSELTGITGMPLVQFKAFSSKDRTSNERDVVWLERAQGERVERIITIAYFAFVKMDAPQLRSLRSDNVEWVAVDEVGTLAFDHNLIIEEALKAVRREADNNRSLLYDLLPKKFTAAQLRMINEIVFGKKLDVRNFHKKLSQLPYVVALEERQKGVAHRAARYYRFDKKAYNNVR